MRKNLFVFASLVIAIMIGGCDSSLSTEETSLNDHEILEDTSIETDESVYNDSIDENQSETSFELRLLDEFTGSNVTFLSDDRLLIENNGTPVIYNENLELIKNIEKGSKVTVLSENRFFVNNDANSIIYDKNFNIIKEVGDLRVYQGEEFRNSIFDGVFVYAEPYYHDSQMDYKLGLMDFEGNILYNAIFINPEEEFEECSDDDGLCKNERIIAEMYDIMDSFVPDGIYEYSNKELLAYHSYSDDNNWSIYDLAIIKTYPDHYEVIKELGTYDDIEYHSGSCYYDNCQYYIPSDNDSIEKRISLGVENNEKWGIIDLEGNYILEPEYEEIRYIGSDESDRVDYYTVINNTGRVGVFSTENGLILEPMFSLADSIYLLDSNIVVQSSNVELTKIYNSNGEIVKEFQFYAEISSIYDFSEEGSYSKKFYNIKKREGSDKLDYGLLDMNFEYSPLKYEIDGYGHYTSYATISDEVIIGYEDLYRSGKTTCGLLTLDGESIENLSCDYISSIKVFNGRYLYLDKKIYELVGL